jgi:hypothetical protein
MNHEERCAALSCALAAAAVERCATPIPRVECRHRVIALCLVLRRVIVHCVATKVL